MAKERAGANWNGGVAIFLATQETEEGLKKIKYKNKTNKQTTKNPNKPKEVKTVRWEYEHGQMCFCAKSDI